MHVLKISSEELYVDNTLPSTFELAQANALQNQGIQVGLIAINIPFSIKQLLYSLIKSLFGISKQNKGSILQQIKILINSISIKIGISKSKITFDKIENINVVTHSFIPWNSNLELKSVLANWKKKGLEAYHFYEQKFGAPDIVHAHSRFMFAGFLASLIKKKFYIPFVLTEHSSIFQKKKFAKLQLQVYSEIISESDYLIAVSSNLRSDILATLKDCAPKFDVIPNLLNPIYEKEDFLVKPKNKELFTFINVASFYPVKNHRLLVEAFGKAFKNDRNVKLVFIGSGGLEQECKEYSKQLGLESQLIFLGKCDQEKVKKELDNADAFVLSSNYETFGVSLIEALSRGLPAISTRCGGPNNIINGDNGILVNSNHVGELSEAMINLKKNYLQYNHEKIRQSAISTYGSGIIAQQLINVYSQFVRK